MPAFAITEAAQAFLEARLNKLEFQIIMDNHPTEIKPQCVCCPAPAKYPEQWCQECWEAGHYRMWWKRIDRLERVKLSFSKPPQS